MLTAPNRVHSELRKVQARIRGHPSFNTTAPSQLASQLALPSTTTCLRIRGAPTDGRPTSAVTIVRSLPLLQGVAAAAPTYGSSYNAGHSLVALFREPFRSAIIYTPNPSGATYSYSARVYDTAAGAINYTQSISANATEDIAPLHWLCTTGSVYGPTAPHGDRLFCGVAPNAPGRWTFVDLNATISVSQTNIVAGDFVDIQRWDQDGPIDLPPISF